MDSLFADVRRMVPSDGRIAVRGRPSRGMAAAAVLAFMVPGTQTCRPGLMMLGMEILNAQRRPQLRPMTFSFSFSAIAAFFELTINFEHRHTGLTCVQCAGMIMVMWQCCILSFIARRQARAGMSSVLYSQCLASRRRITDYFKPVKRVFVHQLL